MNDVGEKLIADASAYRASPTGKTILLVGRVNAGKSSLLNALVGQERALVDAEAGTTRDPVEADVAIAGVRLKIVDTAGRREDPTALEARGQQLAQARRAEAALAIVVYDGSLGWNTLDEALVASLIGDGVPLIVVENKRDLPRKVGREDALRVSAKSGEGIDELKSAITHALALDHTPTLPIASVRQATALREADVRRSGARSRRCRAWAKPPPSSSAARFITSGSSPARPLATRSSTRSSRASASANDGAVRDRGARRDGRRRPPAAPTLCARLDAGAAAFRQQRASRIIVTGRGEAEGRCSQVPHRARRPEGRDRVLESRTHATPTRTRSSSARIVPVRGHVVLVTQRSHQRRAQALFAAQGMTTGAAHAARGLCNPYRLVRERIAFALYRLAGWI